MTLLLKERAYILGNEEAIIDYVQDLGKGVILLGSYDYLNTWYSVSLVRS
jgi:hypothetical protein